MKLIRLIVEAYLQGGGGADWRFCLFATSLLVEIAKNNVTTGDVVTNNNFSQTKAGSICKSNFSLLKKSGKIATILPLNLS